MPDPCPEHARPPAGEHPSGAPAIVLFDGLCVLCDGLARTLARVDRRDRLRFVALQSPAGRWLCEHLDVPDGVDSIVLVASGRTLVESDAVLGICRLLGFPWSLAAALKLVPRPLRDAAYRMVARVRTRLLGKRTACRRPTGTMRRRAIETVQQAAEVLAQQRQLRQQHPARRRRPARSQPVPPRP
ncbi:MAG: hypothetical protein KatS3mg103_1448 [Phycisphaerales bacterium]|nr:MAG: hypothetical protein KatS3mg103_1448 [Phycisphaerales bacterium]